MSTRASAAQEAGEQRLARQDARRVRRTPPVTLAVLIVLLLVTGTTLAVDLRRLDTVGGAALSWVEATTFGDCERYDQLSQPLPGNAELRDDEAVCRELQAQTVLASDLTLVRVVLVSVDEAAGTAVVAVERPDGRVEETLRLVDDGRWRVLRDAAACRLADCP